jgi:murein DD-endopeptidase MepM/ murein hydrolase activator NlpD
VILAGLARRYAEPLANLPAVASLTLPFRMAALVAKPPDAELWMPVANVPVRQVANTWRADRPGGRRHEGQDIFAPQGTPVVSATNGFVVRVGDGGIGGNAVSVLGAGGRVYYYAHLSRFREGLRMGDEVTPKTVLGYVGNTGNARTTAPHLHFGVYSRGGAVNPLPLLTDRVPASRTVERRPV